MAEITILKIKTGSVWLDNKDHGVYLTAYPRTDKSGRRYYVLEMPIFPNKIETKPKEEKKEEVIDV